MSESIAIIKWANIGKWVSFQYDINCSVEPLKIINITYENGECLYWTEHGFWTKDFIDNYVYPIQFKTPTIDECKKLIGKVAVWEKSDKSEGLCELIETVRWTKEFGIYINNKCLITYWMNSNYLINGMPFGTPVIDMVKKQSNEVCIITI